MGIGRLQLLGLIQETGSINKAAKAMNMSYKRAWEMIQQMNRLAESPLVVTQTGGSTGGGTVVTETGLRYMEAYQLLHRRFQAFMAEELNRLEQSGLGR